MSALSKAQCSECTILLTMPILGPHTACALGKSSWHAAAGCEHCADVHVNASGSKLCIQSAGPFALDTALSVLTLRPSLDVSIHLYAQVLYTLQMLPYDASAVMAWVYGGLLAVMGILISWAAPACNNPIFAEIVPPHLRNMIYSFDRCAPAILIKSVCCADRLQVCTTCIALFAEIR